MTSPRTNILSPPALQVTLGSGADCRRLEFRKSVRIGRSEECEVCVKDEHVSRIHAEVKIENGTWYIRDLNSANGLYCLGERFESASIVGSTTIRLGIQGPEVSFKVVQPKKDEPTVASETVIARYVEHYFGKGAADGPAGEHTMFVRKAFEHVQTKQKRRYGYVVGALLIAIIAAGAYGIYEHQEIKRQRATAENLFYSMKTLDVDIANLESAVLSSNNQQSIDVIRNYEKRRKDMERSYDNFLATLHVYNPKMTEQERLVMRVARIFGECELDMPPRLHGRGQSNTSNCGSPPGDLREDDQNGKGQRIYSVDFQEFLAQGLPPQFFYLAMQESDFDPYNSGPMTRKGIAKGMWQFIPETAVKYGLHLGPLVDLRRPDPGDDRHHYDKETKAAASYIRDLYGTDAQASGLLVMACYNWGEGRVLPLVSQHAPESARTEFLAVIG